MIVADTSPLINLVGIGLLDLLPQIYDDVLIPTQVLTEYEAGMQPHDPDLATFSWLHVHPVAIDSALFDELDLGEAATITLAVDHHVGIVLMDDRAGRRAAREHNLEVIGTFAVLLRAKQQHLIPSINPLIDLMIAQGRYISPSLREQILTAANEP